MNFRLFPCKSSFKNMTASQLADHLKKYMEREVKPLAHEVSIEIDDFDPNELDGSSLPAFDKNGNVMSYIILLNSIYLNSARTRDDLDDAFVALAVAAGHEIEHLKQFDNMSPNLAACLIADMGNNYNYRKDSTNYRRNVREIPCEIGGVLFAEEYIRTEFEEIVDRDKRLLRYLNARGSDPGYFIRTPGCKAWLKEHQGYLSRPETQADRDEIAKDPFSSLFRAHQEFCNALLDASKHGRKYHSTVRSTCQDAYVQATKLGQPGLENKAWDPIRTMFEQANSPWDANRMLAAISLYHDPMLRYYSLGVDVSDLTIENVFGCPVPTVERMIENMQERPKLSEPPRTIADMQRQEAEAQKKFEADVERWTQYYKDREKQADETPVDSESVAEPSEPRPSDVLQLRLAEFNAKHAADQARKEKDKSKGYGE